MGNFFKNTGKWFQGKWDDTYGQLDPGPNGNDTPAPGQERRSPDQLQWDPITGMPINANGPPSNDQALAYQYKAQELIRRRQQALWGDAANSIQQGIGLMTSYRPGGSAALASGLYQSRANVFQNQAASLEEPDLMSIYREDKQIQADREARRARNMQFAMSAAGIVAGIATGGAGFGLLAGAGALIGRLGAGGGPTTPGATDSGTSLRGDAGAPMIQGGGAPAVPGGMATVEGQPGVSMQSQAQTNANALAQQTLGGNPGSQGQQNAMATQQAAKSTADAQGQQILNNQGAFGGNTNMSRQSGGSAMAQQQPSRPTFGSDGIMNGMSASAAAMQADPIMESVMLHEMATDENYARSTSLRVASARQRLQRALQVSV